MDSSRFKPSAVRQLSAFDRRVRRQELPLRSSVGGGGLGCCGDNTERVRILRTEMQRLLEDVRSRIALGAGEY